MERLILGTDKLPRSTSLVPSRMRCAAIFGSTPAGFSLASRSDFPALKQALTRLITPRAVRVKVMP